MHLFAAAFLLPALLAPATMAGAGPEHVGIRLNAAGMLLVRQAGDGRLNLQTFTGALGGAAASAIIKSNDPERPFEVDGDTFVCLTRLSFVYFLLYGMGRTGVGSDFKSVGTDSEHLPTERLRVRGQQGVR
jgi:hypothetical protein